MASFIEELWNSIFTPGPTPTLLIATNATFAALQLLFLILLITTYSIHFIILSVLCAGLWYSINWFAREIQIAKAHEEAMKATAASKKQDKPPSGEPESDTETEAPPKKGMAPPIKKNMPPPPPPRVSSLLKPKPAETQQELRKRQSMGDSSGYVSTDSEWDKISDVER